MNTRARAIEVLARVEATDGYLNVVLDHRLSEEPLDDPRDVGFVTELCYGTMRRRLTLDTVIEAHASRKLSALEDTVLAALRIGAYQMFYSRVPRRAAVAETVEALKQLKFTRAVGFCNAILRKLSMMEEIPLPDAKDLARYLSVKESHPQWLVERWLTAFGEPRTRAVLAANNTPAPVVLRTNTQRNGRDELLSQLKESGLELSPTEFSPVGIKLGSSGKLDELYGYREGLWQVQDEAAQLVGIYGAIPDGQTVLDTCAAPGGKACHLAEHHIVLASDLHQNKLRRIQSEAHRLGLLKDITLIAHDATQPFKTLPKNVDAVVIDAPCTGLGTLRRHPELRYRRLAGDVERLAALQAQILDNAQTQVPEGGLLLYAVCSPEPLEGREQIVRFLQRHSDFVLEPPPQFLPAPWLTSDGFLQTFPGSEGFDGFFAARLRRSGSRKH